MSEKISKEEMRSEIESLVSHRVEGSTTTIAVLKTKSGVIFTGESACVSMDDFDEAKGKELAEARAEAKLWETLGIAKVFAKAKCPVVVKN